VPQNEDPFFIPKPYNGVGLVAFLDLLGFSQAIRHEWSNGAVLQRLFDIREDIDNAKRLAFSFDGYPNGAMGYAESALFSDSILIFSNSYKHEGRDLIWPSFFAIAGRIQAAISSAARSGFGVRGGVELGSVYWDGHDAIGPGFLDAYHIETKVKTARVVAGPKLLRSLESELPSSSSMHNHAAYFLGRCTDGCFAISAEFGALGLIEETQRLAPNQHKNRYDDIISITNRKNREDKPLRPAYYRRAANAIEALLETQV
jgi:hypothetical protein